MFISKPRALVRIQRRFPKLSVELLEDRLQPGSVLTGLGFSLLGSSLPGADAGLFVPQDNAAQIAHPRTDDTQDMSILADLALLTSARAGDSASSATSAAPAPTPAQQQVAPSLGLPLISDLPAPSAGGARVSSASLSGPQTAPAPAPIAAGAQATSASQQLGIAAPATATFSQPHGVPQPIAQAATATPIPSAAFHSLTASVVTHVTAAGQGGIHPDAALNWTTYVASAQTTGANVGKAVTVDGLGNIYVTGYTDDGTTRMAFVAEYTSGGTQVAYTGFQAQDPFVNYIESEGHGIAVDVNGGVYVVGKATDALQGDTDAFIMKFDATNQLMPVAGYGGGIGGTFNDSGEGVVVDSAGEATITGTFQPTPNITEMFAAKYTTDGTGVIWVAPYEFMGYDGSAANAIALDSTGTIAYLAGSIHPVGGDNDILVMQIDNTTGNMNWFFTQVNQGDDTLNGIAIDQNGQANVVGTMSVAGGGTNAYVAQLSADGTSLVTQNTLANMQTGNGISLDPNTGNFYVVGSAPDSSSNLHVVVQKFDPSLNPGDSLTISGGGVETGSGVAFDTNSGNVYVVGTTTSTNLSTDGTTLTGTSDAFLSNVGSFN